AHAVATGLGLSPALVDRIATAARLRDVGMLALDGAAPAIVRRDHSLAAREVVGSVTFLRATLDLVDGHHERVDGQGHPLGLVGGEIPLGARVLAVADTWAHLRAEGWSARDAVDHCESQVGQSLDESCVAGLRRALERDQLPQVTS
ncbi:HD-GYP domain-containing protein, partial [Janibacter sp. RAF20_2_2]